MLFERAGRGLVLTPSGLELLDQVRRMGEAASGVSLTASGQAQTTKGNIRISASEIEALTLPPPIIATLRREAPGIDVEVVGPTSRPTSGDARRISPFAALVQLNRS